MDTFFILTGAGQSFAYLSSDTILPVHFGKSKFLVLLLADSGYGLGSLVAPLFFLSIIERYGYKVSWIIYASLAVVSCISAAFYFPATTTVATHAGGSVKHTEHASIREDMDIRSDNCSSVNVEDSDHSSRGACLGTTVSEGRIRDASGDVAGHCIGEVNHGMNTKVYKKCTSIQNEIEGKDNHNVDIEETGHITFGQRETLRRGAKTETSNYPSDTKGYGGQTSRQSGCFVKEQTWNAPNEDETRSCREKIMGMTDFHIMKNPLFVAIAIALFGYGTASAILSYMVVLFEEKGLSRSDSVINMIVAYAATAVLGPLVGRLFSISFVQPYVKYFYAVACILNGCLVAITGSISTFPAFVVVSLVRGLAANIINGCFSGFMAELFGVEHMMEYIAGGHVFRGIALVVGPFIAGKQQQVRDSCSTDI